MRLTVTAALVCLALTLVHHAGAQSVIVSNSGNRVASAAEKPETISVTLQLALPAPAISSSADMTKAMAAASQSLYDIVNRECDVLTAVLKGSCRLARLNIGGNYNDMNANILPYYNRPNPTPVVNATAAATFEIEMTTKAEAAPKP